MAELSRKAGKDTNFLNFVPIAEVRIKQGAEFKENSKVEGSYSSKNGITIYTGSINDVSTLWTLIHEELHAVSEGMERIRPEGENKKSLAISQGIMKQFVDFSDEEVLKTMDLHRNCNEGFTELLTDKIVDEYLRQTGADKTFKIDMKAYKDLNDLYSEYDRYKWLMHFYISVLSALAGLPAEVVEGAMTRLYIRNGYLIPREVEEELAILNDELTTDLWLLLIEGSWERDKIKNFYNKLGMSDKFSQDQKDALNKSLLDYALKSV